MARTARAHCCLGLTQWHCTAGAGPSTQSNQVRRPKGMGAIMGRANQGVRRSGSNAGGRAGHVDPEYWNWPKNKQQIQKQGKRGRGSGRGVQFLIVKKCQCDFIFLILLEENGGQDKKRATNMYFWPV